MKFQVVSDIHLELNSKPPEIIVTAEYLILCGDIGIPGKRYNKFLKDMSTKYLKVFLVLGNHEYYSTGICESEKLGIILPENVVLLSNKTFTIGNIKLIGSTLWSEISDAAFQLLSDKQYLRKSAYDLRNLHWKNVKWISSEILNTSEEIKIIVITHHAPSFKALPLKYYNSPLNSGFCTDLEHLFSEKILYWCFGHIHNNIQKRINGTTLISNCYGILEEQDDFDPSLSVSVNQ